MIKELKGNNSGMTMVEVLMGFLILSIILGGVVTLISFSSNMYFKSVDEKKGQTEVMENAYKESPTPVDGFTSKTDTVTVTTESGDMLTDITRQEISENTFVFSYTK